ncbi:MAG: hypothetical protein JWO30_2490 [Fibrobacteres bacterium]|nr:hypothetical protein [Fibrobacterota bacterium]
MPLGHDRWKKNVSGISASTALLALALAAGTHAQTGAAAWEPLGVKWTPNATWGPQWGKSPSRLASDARGTLFLSQGDSLYVGAASGKAWKAAPVSLLGSVASRPLAVGSGGRMLWGTWTSPDWGETWTRLTTGGSQGYNVSAALSPSGYCLFGQGYDFLRRGETLEAPAIMVHRGRTYGSIVDIAISTSGTVFASPQYDDLLISRDSGKTWKERRSILKAYPALPRNGKPVSGYLTLETGYAQSSVWVSGGNSYDTNRVEEFRDDGDSLSAVGHANANLPDSAITALRIQPGVYASALWLGTWGQGVYRSLDRGESWQAANAGLADLHVEAMVLGQEGRVFVLTRSGLYAIAPASASMTAPDRGKPDNGHGASNGDGHSIHPMPRFGNAAGDLFRADGRIALPGKNVPESQPR